MSNTAEPTDPNFTDLPVEVTQNVASFLDNYADLYNFTWVNKQAYGAVHSSQSGGLWVQLFAHTFELLPNKLGRELKEIYLSRHELFHKLPRLKFGLGYMPLELESIEMIKALIIESFSDISSDDHLLSNIKSKNVGWLHRIALGSRLLENLLPRAGQWPDIDNPNLLAVQVLLLSWFLDPFLNPQNPLVARKWECSQHVVYQSPAVESLFYGAQMESLNLQYVLHIGKFFKRHLTDPRAATLYGPYCDLDADMRPQAWTEQLVQGVKPLAGHWKGTHSAYDLSQNIDFRAFRVNSPNDEEPITDVIGEGGDLDDFMLMCEHPHPWIPAFERHLKAYPPIKPGEAPPHHLTFTGGERLRGMTDILGTIHAIPPQMGIPGWQRVSFMRYDLAAGFMLTNLHNDNDLAEKLNYLCCYEGVVLPGGKIMMGRWWSPLDPDLFSGPFIYWAVEYACDREEV